MNLANLTGTVSKAAQYLIIVLMVIYTVQSYTVFAQRNRTDREQIFLRQNVSMFVIHFLAYLIMYLNTAKFELILFYGAQVLYLMFTLLLYRNLYPRASRSLINNMCMLLSVGFIMITRLSYDQSVKQFEIAAAGTAIALLIPLIVRKLLVLTKMTWGYVFVGIGLLALVMIAANVTNGARLAIYIAGFSFQASEFVKIIFVFAVAGLLSTEHSFRRVVIATVLSIVNVVMHSDMIKKMDAMDSLVEQFRIPVDGTWYYGETSGGASVNSFKKGQKQTNIEMLHEFIYGAYYPAG